MMQYLEIARGSVMNRNFVDKASCLKDYVEKAQSAGDELYRSMYYYDEEILEHLKIRKTVKSYRGKYYLGTIIFDIDKKQDTDQFVQRRAQEFALRLSEDWKVDREQMAIYFSGRGYHFYIDNIFRFEPSNHLPEEVKMTLGEYFPEVDPAIYTSTALIRVPYTINNKAKRYKVQITYDELFEISADEIIEIAQSPEKRGIETADIKSTLDYSVRIKHAKRTAAEVKRDTNLSDIITCVQKIYNEGPIQGSRHINMLRMISSFRRKGLPKEAIFVLMRQWADNLEEAEIRKDVDDVFSKDYKFGCFDPVLAKYCDPMCMYYQKKNMMPEMRNSDELEKDFIEFLKGDFLVKSINLKEVLDLEEDFWCYPGEVILFIGDTKLGKSALTQLLALRIKLKVLYYNLEFSENLFFRRNVQIARNWTKERVIKHYGEHPEVSLKAGTEHIKAIFRPPAIEDIPKTVKELGANFVIIDTVDKVVVGKLGEYRTREAKVAMTMKDIAKESNSVIFLIHHIPKSEAKGFDGKPKSLTIHSGKGDSSYEQQADKVIGMWGSEADGIRFVKSLGARDESPFFIQMYYNKPTFRFSTIIKHIQE